ncbi:hypothetical protein P7L74_08645 [Tistrella mobilis]|uniref:hypothetical protein n=1 Tax=Tistrella mobilis TaxID=171437 RepID=UPI003556EB6C
MTVPPLVLPDPDVLHAALARAATDDGYHALFLSDPAAALATMGIVLPAGAQLRVHRPRRGRLLLTLPPFTDAPVPGGLGPLETAMWRAATDPVFRADLRVAPVAMLRGQGVDIAAGLIVDVIDAEPGLIDLILPDPVSATATRRQAVEDLEFDDEDLDLVAGGTSPPDPGSMVGASTWLTLGGIIAYGIGTAS